MLCWRADVGRSWQPSLRFAQHAIEMFRRSLPDGAPKHRLDQLANRLTKILAETGKLKPGE
jgi:hypothetical protein